MHDASNLTLPRTSSQDEPRSARAPTKPLPGPSLLSTKSHPLRAERMFPSRFGGQWRPCRKQFEIRSGRVPNHSTTTLPRTDSCRLIVRSQDNSSETVPWSIRAPSKSPSSCAYTSVLTVISKANTSHSLWRQPSSGLGYELGFPDPGTERRESTAQAWEGVAGLPSGSDVES